jgi:cytoskeleton protein RodZ
MNTNNKDVIKNNDLSNLDTIGILLQTARKNRNENLNDVAKQLRIRQVYLEAIENDQFEILPGDIYVIGFIKSYSKHLDLDSEEIIERYESEISKYQTKEELKFPAYVPQNGIPGGSVLLLGLLIAIISYSGWYFFSATNSVTTEQIASVPKPLMPLVRDKPVTPLSPKKYITKEDGIESLKILKKLDKKNNNKNLNERRDEEDPSSNTQKNVLEKLVPKMNKPEVLDSQTTIKEILLPEKNIPQQFKSKSDPVISTEPGTKLNIEAAAEKELEPSVNLGNKTKKILEVSEVIDTSNNKPKIKSPPDPSQQTQLPPSRIILEALADSYIQVRDNNVNRLLTTRLLRKGQRYKVPDRSGLTLLTGNAGALKILVDGIVVPEIGPIGAIRRNVILDVIKLKDGLAVIE